jgi:hypothetical protein
MSARLQTKVAASARTPVSAARTPSTQSPAFSPESVRTAVLSPSIGLRLQRKCDCGKTTEAEGECAECKKKKELQRRATGQAPERVPSIVHDVLRSHGQPLDEPARESMEQRFGHDFNDVRVHADARAGESARAVNALAFTVGSNVVFAPGQYQPASAEGQRLLAHELTHVVQQRGASGSLSSLSIADSNSHAEREADSMAGGASAPTSAARQSAPRRITPAPQALHKQGPGDANAGSGFNTGLGSKLQVDPKLTAQFLAMCAMGQGDPLLCAKIRAQSDPSSAGATTLTDPGAGFKITPEMMREAQDKVNPPTGNQASPAAADPVAPAPRLKSPWSSDVLSGTIVEYKSPAAQFKVSIPDGVAAKFRAQIHDAQFIRINIGVSTSAQFTASIKIDNVPIELSSTIDPIGNKASVSLKVFGATSKCATSVDPAVVAKVQDAGQKVEAAWKAFQAPATPVPTTTTAKPADPSQTGLAKDIQDVKNTVGGVVDKLQPEIALGTAIAAFVSAVEAVEKAKKTPCVKASIMFGATFDTPLNPDPNDPLNKPRFNLGLSGTF